MKLSVPVETEKNELTPETAQALVKTDQGLGKLVRLLKQTFPDEKLVEYIRELCEAEDVKMTKGGESYATPNWDARKNGLDRALELLRYKKKTDELNTMDRVPVKIVFNVVGATKETIQIKKVP